VRVWDLRPGEPVPGLLDPELGGRGGRRLIQPAAWSCRGRPVERLVRWSSWVSGRFGRRSWPWSGQRSL